MVAEHGLAGGADSQTLFQLVGAAHRDPRHLRREAIDQLAFLLQQALRDQHGHCHVLMAGGLEAGIHILLDELPDRLTIGAQDDEAFHAGILDQLCLDADVGIPLCEVLLLTGDRLYELFVVFCHFNLILPRPCAKRSSFRTNPYIKPRRLLCRVQRRGCGAFLLVGRSALVAVHKLHHITLRDLSGVDVQLFCQQCADLLKRIHDSGLLLL